MQQASPTSARGILVNDTVSIYKKYVARLLEAKFSGNRPCSIYQYSHMAPRLSGQPSIFGGGFFVFNFPRGQNSGTKETLQLSPKSLRTMLILKYIKRDIFSLSRN